MPDFYFHCKLQYNDLTVVDASKTDSTLNQFEDLVTGLITVTGYQPSYRKYTIAAGQGTTLSAGLIANDTNWPVTSTATYTVGKKVSVLLDNGVRHWATCTAVNAGPDIDVNIGVPSAAASGNDVVGIDQLSGTVLGSIDEDFKIPKTNDIFNKSDELWQTSFTHNNFEFPLTGEPFDPNIRYLGLQIDYRADNYSYSEVITGITQSNPAVITVSSIGDIRQQDVIDISGIVGMTELNGNVYSVGPVTGNTFELYNVTGVFSIDSTLFTAYVSGGLVDKGDQLTNQPVITSEGTPYLMADSADFLSFENALFTRRAQIIGPMGGQIALLTAVKEALNTSTAMDAIADNRT